MLTISRVSGEASSANEYRVDVIHEMLLRRWSRCQRWIDEERNGLELREEVERSADTWAAQGRHSGYLPRGALLAHQSGELLGSPSHARRYEKMLHTVAQEYLEAARELAAAEADRAKEALRSGLKLAKLIHEKVARGLVDRKVSAALRRQMLSTTTELMSALVAAVGHAPEHSLAEAAEFMEQGDAVETSVLGSGDEAWSSSSIERLDPPSRRSLDAALELPFVSGSSQAPRNQSMSLERIRDNATLLHNRLTTSEDCESAVTIPREVSSSTSMPEGDTASARRFQEEAERTRRTPSADAGYTERQREASVSLSKRGDAAMKEGDTAGARWFYEDALTIRRMVSSSDPGNAEWQRDVSVSLNRLGDLSRSEGDMLGAQRFFQEALEIRQGLSFSEAGNMQLLLEVAMCHLQMHSVAADPSTATYHGAAVREIVDALERCGALTNDPRVALLRKAITP